MWCLHGNVIITENIFHDAHMKTYDGQNNMLIRYRSSRAVVCIRWRSGFDPLRDIPNSFKTDGDSSTAKHTLTDASFTGPWR